MVKAFYQPHAVIDFFLKENTLLYVIFPFVLSTTLFEISYILDYVNNSPAFFHFLGNILCIPANQWNFYQIFLMLPVHIGFFLIYGAVVHVITKLIRVKKIDIKETVLLLVFSWNTIALLAFVTENLAINKALTFLFVFQPAYLLASILYPGEFMHKQANLKRWQAYTASAIAIVIALSFRMMFLG